MRAITTPRVLRAVRDRKWTVAQALAELIDNALGELRGRASSIWISWHPKRRVLTILDDGQGMRDVIDLFTLGKGQDSGAGDNGVYGVGGSEALLWLGAYVEVQTLRKGRLAHGKADWEICIAQEEYPNIDTRWRTASATNCWLPLLECEHGTMIYIELRKGLQLYPDHIQERLSRLFAVALRNDRHITWITSTTQGEVTTQLHEWDPGPLEDVIDTTVLLDDDLSAHVRAGHVLGLSLNNSKLSVNYVYRQVKETMAGFGRPVQGAVGYVDLSAGWLRCLTTTKDDIRDDCRDLEDALMAKIAEILQPLIEKLLQAKRAKIFTNVRINLKHRFDKGFQMRAQTIDEPIEPEEVPLPEEETDEDVTTPRKRRARELGIRAGEIEVVSATDDSLRGMLCEVELDQKASYAVAFINIDHELLKMALDAEPVNQRLLEQILISSLAKELVEKNALVAFGLLSQRDLDALLERYNGNTWDVLLYVIRILTDGVVQEQ